MSALPSNHDALDALRQAHLTAALTDLDEAADPRPYYTTDKVTMYATRALAHFAAAEVILGRMNRLEGN